VLDSNDKRLKLLQEKLSGKTTIVEAQQRRIQELEALEVKYKELVEKV